MMLNITRIQLALSRQIELFDPRRPLKSSLIFIKFVYSRGSRILKLLLPEFNFFRPDIEILVLGGVGDLVVSLRWVREFINELENDVKICIYSGQPKIAKWVLNAKSKNITYKDELRFQPGNSMPQLLIGHDIKMFHNNKLELSRLIKTRTLKQSFNLEIVNHEKNEKTHPVLGREVTSEAISAGKNRSNYIFFKTGLKYPGDLIELEIQDYPVPQRYITIHNGYDANFKLLNESSTKNYPHFEYIVKQIEEKLKLPVVQLGISKTSKSLKSSINLLDKTTFQETAYVIKNSLLHLDIESGLVHLASALGTKSLVLFGPTPKEYFGYEGNINLSLLNCNPCWWLKNGWMAGCMLPSKSHMCLVELDPDFVLKQAIEFLSSTKD
jgi:hypothetical protein